MNVFLELTSKSSGPKTVRLKSMTVIGRSKRCQIRISSTEVSREHCQIAVTYDGAFLVDLGSSNGTEVDGRRVKPGAPVQLATGMRIAIGPAHFIVKCEEQDEPDSSENGDSFVIAREKPMNDTALLNRGPVPTQLDADAKPPASPRDAMTELSFSVIDDSQDDEFSVWDSSVLEADGNAGSIHEPAETPEKQPAAKPKKPFSLFSLLKRSSPADEQPDESKEEANGPDTTIQKGSDQAAETADHDAEGDDTSPDETVEDSPHKKSPHDELSEFLKKLS